ncbi:LytTR family DNA-binding domain-containing protein [Niveispirillum sp. KHB5.9]|uniref:LytTR family DNA-binding domain-containing protein n=1 Tax=Niveispirillum sp. KHB5.9 TaxID=3400269 RepID=UPI003A88EB85
MQSPPPLSRLLVIWIAASIAVAIAGPFGTISFPFELRLPYWLGLIGINQLKWTLWFRFGVRRFGPQPRTMMLLALVGVVVINLPLPLEVMLANMAVGAKGGMHYATVYGSSAAMGVTLALGIAALQLTRRKTESDVPILEPEVPAESAPLTDGITGSLLTRAGVTDAAQVMAVEAEDHYLRLHLADGRKPLVLYRLRDALAELSHLEGEQVHRGHWVAARAVQGLERREGRKWALRLECGLLVPVSATFMPAVRRRGWRELAV